MGTTEKPIMSFIYVWSLKKNQEILGGCQMAKITVGGINSE